MVGNIIRLFIMFNYIFSIIYIDMGKGEGIGKG